ncbi:PQQ-binding-like beta-propeller repeat protein [Kineobactrum salinum]|uniref:PQQ-binding-like beta-propeller repeat protein n=2 Tax=Kineobactrum salinum TaxID=2708301 RepID=A0A6C0U999_9GAMM|nr:PQQ-binding-like beta-propeller repeat protein [Kineobactrum salinum]
MLGAEAILAALEAGPMQSQGEHLSEAQRRLLAEHLGSGKLRNGWDSRDWFCTDPFDANLSKSKTHAWGFSPENTRHISDAGLTAEEMPQLVLKWAFAYPGATRARSQPTVVAGVVYVGSQSGSVYALDLQSGCVYWRFDADAEVRSAISFGLDGAAGDGGGESVYFGDFSGSVYRVNARTGKLLWRAKVGDHPDVTITGSPQLHRDRLYVPLSSTEWARATDPSYACCNFRGGVVALSVTAGKQLWKTHVIPQVRQELTGDPENVRENDTYSGAPVWNTPTIDRARNLLYVGTGQSYTSPAHRNSDAVIAMDLDSGEIKWSRQLLSGDAWNLACLLPGEHVNCPEQNGPDFDIGAPPILWSDEQERELLLVGQKSGMVYALDPDLEGETVWKRKLGRGGFSGGVHWGMAADSQQLYVPIADTEYFGKYEKLPASPGLFALDPKTGMQMWFAPAGDHCLPEQRPACDPGLSAAVTSVPGAVLAGGFDGMLKAYTADTGAVIWQYDTNREFTTVSGVSARGGSIESDGPVVSEGHLLVNSGYLYGGRLPGNVLLVFGRSL